jgi:hypothetical protein
MAGWLFEPLSMDPEAWAKITGDLKTAIQMVGGGLGRLEKLEHWEIDDIKNAMQDELHILGANARDFLEPQRITVTGRLVSTGVYESIWLLGRDEALARYRTAMGTGHGTSTPPGLLDGAPPRIPRGVGRQVFWPRTPHGGLGKEPCDVFNAGDVVLQ